MTFRILAIVLTLLVALPATADGNGPAGLKKKARAELELSGVTKYVDQFAPVASFPAPGTTDWVQHLFDPNAPVLPEGPTCITGSPYSVFTRARDPEKLLILLQGGGACWQDFYNCSPVIDGQEPPPQAGQGGLVDSFLGIDNPISDYSIVYLPYCDGSVFIGDNTLFDPAFGEALGVPQLQFRFHRGLQNLSAGMDVAKNLFPEASKILVAGSSAGGVGAASFAPFLARFAFGNDTDLVVLNDAGPNASNLNEVDAAGKRANDWQFGQFFPASCTDCGAYEQGTEIVKWRLKNDKTIREAFYSTDGDCTNRFFVNLLFDPAGYRDLVVDTHGEINQKFPNRYKRFIRSGDNSHTAFQRPLYYFGTANGTPLYQWVDDLMNPPATGKGFGSRKGKAKTDWIDIVEDFEPAPSCF